MALALGSSFSHLFETFIPFLKNTTLSFDCEICVLAKNHKHSYFPSSTRSATSFALIHSDVWGTTYIFTTHHFSYHVLFVDDCTRMSWVYLWKHKS